ncbi:MAG: glycosyltransferase [Kiloniellales bacterium]|nr:glycosyltransferase [Kiloniellales bacterium]
MPEPAVKDPKPKIAFLLPDLGGGGAESMIVRLANAFAARGYRVDLVVFQAEGPNHAAVSPGVREISLGVTWWPASPLAIRRYLSRERPDLLISALFHANIFALTARLLLPFTATRFVVTERNMLSVHVRYSKRKTRHFFFLAARLLYRFADKVVGVSRGVAEDIGRIARLPADKVTWIYNPTASPECLARAEAAVDDPWLDKAKPPVILNVGRLEPQKDQANLLRAFAKLPPDQRGSLLILGAGSLQDELEGLSRELGIDHQVRFAGYIDNPLAYMRRADLYVLSSLYEGFPNALVEALLCGLPIVSTDCPSGPGEILGANEFGLLVPERDPEAMARAITRSLARRWNPEGQRSRALEFSLERSADQFEELVRQLWRPRAQS